MKSICIHSGFWKRWVALHLDSIRLHEYRSINKIPIGYANMYADVLGTKRTT